MKKRIILASDCNPFEKFDYSVDYNTAMKRLGKNSGNTVFQYALQAMLTDENVDLTVIVGLFWEINHAPDFWDKINNSYDCVVYSPANIISEFAKGYILEVARNAYQNIKIPIYVIGLGAQSDREYSMDFLQEIKTEAYETFKILLEHNGRIAVRGYFTGECLKKIGFSENDFTVTGCPSIFMKGPGLKIEKKNVLQEDFVPLMNGFRIWNHINSDIIFKKYPNSYFVCQEEFYRLLYLPNDLTWKEYQYLSDENEKWFHLYQEDRIKLYCNFQSWYLDVCNRNTSFSYGCRIHGNIVPILAGVPAYIDSFDSRVKELAEYFEIPNSYLGNELPDPYDLYQQTDYGNFNRHFSDKYQTFAKFMDSCGLPHNAVREIAGEVPTISREQREMIWKQKQQAVIYETSLKQRLSEKKIAFVAHEFGLYENHGGIASYLYQMAKYIVENYEMMDVYVLAGAYDQKCNLLDNTRFHMYPLDVNDYSLMSFQVLELLKTIRPDYVEAADYGALCLESLIYKHDKKGELNDTKFFINNHSATRECFEWSMEIPLELAESGIMITSLREKAQMYLADQCISPSDFLGNYVSKRYGIDHIITLRHPTNVAMVSKKQLQKKLEKEIDIEQFQNKFVISCISRFEGRKRQLAIVKTFCEITEETGWDALLILAGNSTTNITTSQDYREQCFREIPEALRSRFLFFDYADYEMKQKIYAVSDLGIMASVYENFPVSLTEYVYHEVPVMVSKYNGAADYMQDTYEYTVFNPFDDNSLKEKIIQFYRLGKYNWNDLALKQCNALHFITNPKKAVFKKLGFFEAFTEGKDGKSLCRQVEITEHDLTKKIQTADVIDIFFAENIETLKILREIYSNYRSVINRHNSNALYTFNRNIYARTQEIISTATNLIIPGIEISNRDIGSTWEDFLVKEIGLRIENVIVIPALQEIAVSKKFLKCMNRISRMIRFQYPEFTLYNLYGKSNPN